MLHKGSLTKRQVTTCGPLLAANALASFARDLADLASTLAWSLLCVHGEPFKWRPKQSPKRSGQPQEALARSTLCGCLANQQLLLLRMKWLEHHKERMHHRMISLFCVLFDAQSSDGVLGLQARFSQTSQAQGLRHAMKPHAGGGDNAQRLGNHQLPKKHKAPYLWHSPPRQSANEFGNKWFPHQIKY